jgi:hypothetical protein
LSFAEFVNKGGFLLHGELEAEIDVHVIGDKLPFYTKLH